ncbi:restriction endonuclease subunit S [Arcanobacterium bovis]|uniref:Restriction endonuclease subunit S n=1 Tax=Arcanobacterium bovis TaxID=2529275 RepID=A0A4V2KR90_9ACTO|nr:restriction endonuclease subunit S [Arcanobacterium bovis]TBW22899.1 restriction endonuclease subunit S [Arcanobacterium bovis]
MNKIEKLIAQLCPDGVPYDQLGNLLNYEQPTRYLVKSNDYFSDAPIPVLTAGQTFILGYTRETEGIYEASKEDPVIIFDDFTTAFQWVDFPFKAKSSAMKMLTPKTGDSTTLRFLFHLLQTIQYSPQNHARQWIGTYSNFRIPVPPLEVQEEIVRILDSFTQLEAELEAELEARKHQFTHYCNHAFSTEKIQEKSLGEMGDFRRGTSFQKIHIQDYGIPAIHYGEIFTYYGSQANKTRSFVAPERFAKKRTAWPGDVILATTSENDEDVAKAVAWLGSERIVISNDALIYRSDKLEPRYFSYFIRSDNFQNQKKKFLTGTKVRRISAQSLMKIDIPVPPLDEQKRIADILDMFDALANDISSGLPVEIEARRKQYEYYRDKLLSFEELPA